MYCGEQLPVIDELKKDLSSQGAKARERDPNVQLDPLSQMTTQFQQSLAGFNVVLRPVLEEEHSKVSETASKLGFHTANEIKTQLNLNNPIPIARYQN